MNSRWLRIAVLGYIVRGPLGGLAWHHLQYVLGLVRLGHDVYFLEDSDDYASCYDPSVDAVVKDPTYGLAFAANAFGRIGLPDRWGYYDAHTRQWHGPIAGQARHICRSADVLLNLSGVNPLREWLRDVPVRVFIDTDPVFTQVRHLTEPQSRILADGHTAFFTFGENFGRPECSTPDDGYRWLPTRQPICLDVWSQSAAPECGHFTTVMQWDSYPPQEYGGVRYGMKSDAFEPYLTLPQETGAIFELALGSPSAPRDVLKRHGWRLCDPLNVTRDPWSYQQYILQSRAEFSVAKQGYVTANCGWFSERSAAYLASGRPVLVQDTGFRTWLTAQHGALAFTTRDEARSGVERIQREYSRHCRAAREIATQYFESDRVLGELLDRALR